MRKRRSSENNKLVWVKIENMFDYEVFTDIPDKPLYTYKYVDGVKVCVGKDVMSLKRFEVQAKDDAHAVEIAKKVLFRDWNYKPTDYNITKVNKMRNSLKTKHLEDLLEDDEVVDLHTYYKK